MLVSGAETTGPPQFFFKRYLEFETQHGSEARVEEVKRKAVEFVEQFVSS